MDFMQKSKKQLSQAHFSGHETFPLRQMWLKKAFDQVVWVKSKGTPVIGKIPKSTFTDANSISIFGVGKNMVSSIRHWALACEVLRESSTDSDCFEVSELGSMILRDDGLDPYLEHPSTAWYAHWCLAGKGHRSTTWRWLFNNVTTPNFNRQELELPLQEYAKSIDNNKKISTSTLSRDLETCLRSYAPRTLGSTPEDFAEPLLGELGLIQETHKGQYSFRRGPKATLSNALFAYSLLDFWERTSPGVSSMAFETIAYGEGSPGRVFKLDENSIAERLIALDELTEGHMAWTETAGMRQVFKQSSSIIDWRSELINKAYEQ
ncbi:DUF4007 family protein [Pseudomonas sp. GZD-209]|uniref:DUF4007 family protein n=1 Tax=Pseudomonas sp. GZD-209 TaxID=3404807 RepID=UPI003BB6DC24